MMNREKFDALKKANPGVIALFHTGDFYELFFEDAELAAKKLGLVLTVRGKNLPDPMPMAGFPQHHLETYLRKLIREGHRVAVCEQVNA